MDNEAKARIAHEHLENCLSHLQAWGSENNTALDDAGIDTFVYGDLLMGMKAIREIYIPVEPVENSTPHNEEPKP